MSFEKDYDKKEKARENSMRDRYAHPMLRDTVAADVASCVNRGVRLWRPDSRVWMSVSPLGWTYEYSSFTAQPRSHHDRYQKMSARLVGQPSDSKNTKSNEIVDGSILDIYGVLISFSSATTLKTLLPRLTPNEIIKRLNDRNPTCPVLYNSLVFTYASAHERALREYARLRQKHINRLQCNGANDHLQSAPF